MVGGGGGGKGLLINDIDDGDDESPELCFRRLDCVEDWLATDPENGLGPAV